MGGTWNRHAAKGHHNAGSLLGRDLNAQLPSTVEPAYRLLVVLWKHAGYLEIRSELICLRPIVQFVHLQLIGQMA
jgi:hypothetical protein